LAYQTKQQRFYRPTIAQDARAHYFVGMAISSVNLAIFIAMGLVFAVLVAGIINLSMNSDKARSRSNQLMRLRVLAQFIAIVLLMVGFWLKTHIK
jgi:Hypoxia induced protein conserved region